ncbi:MAG: LodA/GoxA family CTQ-dependent oxidase [Verrucomicrobia bacterium]|nr:LodA/GoxA family CTQ-dependent oxidase [Verrucomicrobiota bacterium]
MNATPTPACSTTPSAPADSTIVRAEIHPAIGVARVGNSESEYYLAPEVPDPAPQVPGFYRDATGALKREAVRFRIFGYNAAGEVVAELTADQADIEWTVHVANKKAAWYEFTLAMDIPEVFNAEVQPAARRNARVQGSDRDKLVIDPGPRSIRGCGTAGAAYQFDTGRFFDLPVYLGEVRTDDAGRLIFLGGRGVSRSVYSAPPFDFANNDGWHDDVSDGPVTARVVIGGREIPVESAWVTVGPPNYAPELKSVRTMYDLFEDMSVGSADPGTVSFQEHILPIFERMCRLQWVNLGFAEQFGWKAPQEFVRPEYLAQLGANPQPANPGNVTALAELRTEIFNHFRNYATNNGWRGLWPWIYGDAMDIDGAQHRDLALSNLQLARLAKWAAGDFVADYSPNRSSPANLEAYPLAERPNRLTEAALSFCIADAFHPGCEITWVIRSHFLYRNLPANPKDTQRLRYSRFRVRPATLPDPDYGDVLDPRAALSSGGALNSLGPGGLTRWMAVPWQTDTASCRSGYEQYTFATPTFWPARVPNHVLTEADYNLVMNADLPLDERWAAFRRRANWLRDLGGGFESIVRMITEFGLLGVVERRPGPGGEFPKVLLVEIKPPSVKLAAVMSAKVSAPEANGLPGDPHVPKLARLRNRAAHRR